MSGNSPVSSNQAAHLVKEEAHFRSLHFAELRNSCENTIATVKPDSIANIITLIDAHERGLWSVVYQSEIEGPVFDNTRALLLKDWGFRYQGAIESITDPSMTDSLRITSLATIGKIYVRGGELQLAHSVFKKATRILLRLQGQESDQAKDARKEVDDLHLKMTEASNSSK